MEPPKTVQQIADFLRRLPSVGTKSSLRLAYACLALPREDLEAFCSALERALTTIHTCPECGLLIDGDSCPICSDSTRDGSTLMVVTSAKDVLAIENSDSFRGRYFVLNGTLSPAAHRTLESTGINRLLAKVQAGGIREVICCTGADLEGETTALYIASALKETGVEVTRPAEGLPSGAVLEYADPVTLGRAIKGRTKIEEE